MRDRPLTLMVAFAHPDDESFGTAGILAKYAAEGVITCVVSATRGEAGQLKGVSMEPGQSIAELREGELRCACELLATRLLARLSSGVAFSQEGERARWGVSHLRFLDYRDGTLDQVSEEEAVGRLVRVIRELRPDVLVTFGPEGIHGHPDHLAVPRWATAAFADAADPDRYPEHLEGGFGLTRRASSSTRSCPRSGSCRWGDGPGHGRCSSTASFFPSSATWMT